MNLREAISSIIGRANPAANTPAPAFAEPRPKSPPKGEVATTADGRDITRGYVDSLPLLAPQDAVLQLRGGGNLAVYEDVLRDWQVKSTLSQRRMALISKEWEVQPGGQKRADKKAADSLKAMLDDLGGEDESIDGEQAQPVLGWDDVTSKMLAGVFWGYAVGECIYARDGAEIVLERVKVKQQRRFAFAPTGALRLLTTPAPLGEPLPRRKFWTFTTGADDHDDPYGLGLAHWLYWPVLFKKQGLKFWLSFVEKFAAPTAVGRFPPNASADEREALLEAAGAVASDSGIIIPDGMMLELLEATRGGTSDYATLQAQMDAAISKVILGHSAVADATPGRLGGEDLAGEVRDEVIKADADLVCNSFNVGPARWLTDWNHPGAAYPRVWRRIESEPDLKPQAERDKMLFDMGYRPTETYVRDTYGDGFERHEPPPDPGQPAPPGTDGQPAPNGERGPGQEQTRAAAFAEAIERLAAPGETELAALDRAMTDETAQATMEPILRPILDAAEDDPEALMATLAERFTDMDTDALQDMLARVLFVAETWGRLTAEA